LLNIHANNFGSGHVTRSRALRSQSVLKQVSSSLLGVCLLLLPWQTFALGLGTLEVQSYLDEPLRAAIELRSVSDQPLQSITVQLAPRSDFANAGIERTAQLSSLRFAIKRMPSGKPVIQITTLNGVSEPYLHFLLSVDWAGGRIQREYTALLDPPTYAATLPPTVVVPQQTIPVSPPAVVAITPVAPAMPTVAADRVPPPPAASSAATSTPVGRALPTPVTTVEISTHKVIKGETAWQIARSMRARTPDVSVFQLLQTLRSNNPQAFINNNINLLKAGARLRLPDAKQVRAVSKQEARKQYRLQLDLWQAYQNYVSSGSRTAAKSPTPAEQASPSAVSNIPEQTDKVKSAVTENIANDQEASIPQLSSVSPTPKLNPAATVKDAVVTTDKVAASKAKKEAVAATDSQQDLLKIVQTTVSKDAGTALQAGANDTVPGTKIVDGSSSKVSRLQAKITAMEENLLSRDLENKDLRERVALLEQQVQNATRLIEIRNQQLAQIQNKQLPTPVSTSTSPEQVTAVESPVAEQPGSPNQQKLAQPKTTDAESTQTVKIPSVDKAEVSKSKPVAAAQQVAKPPLKPRPLAKKTPSKTAPPGKPWWQEIYDSVTGNQTSLIGLGGGVILLGVALLALLRRRRKEDEPADEEGSQPMVAAIGNEPDAEDSDSSFLSDFGLSGMGMQAAEVDPLAEAEVYMAYGRDEQAEEVLREAMSRDPSRSEIKLKLLDIYEQRSDLNSFETLAQQMSPQHSGYDKDAWLKVVDMGQRLSPENPLFASTTTQPSVEDKSPSSPPEIANLPDPEAPIDAVGKSVRTAITENENPFASLDPELGAVEFDPPDTDRLASLMDTTGDSLPLEGIHPPSLDLPDLDLESSDELTTPAADIGAADTGATTAGDVDASAEIQQNTAHTVTDEETVTDLSALDLSDFDLQLDLSDTPAENNDDSPPAAVDSLAVLADDAVVDLASEPSLDFDFSDLDLELSAPARTSLDDESKDAVVLDANTLEDTQQSVEDDAYNLFDVQPQVVDREPGGDLASVTTEPPQPDSKQDAGPITNLDLSIDEEQVFDLVPEVVAESTQSNEAAPSAEELPEFDLADFDFSTEEELTATAIHYDSDNAADGTEPAVVADEAELSAEKMESPAVQDPDTDSEQESESTSTQQQLAIDELHDLDESSPDADRAEVESSEVKAAVAETTENRIGDDLEHEDATDLATPALQTEVDQEAEDEIATSTDLEEPAPAVDPATDEDKGQKTFDDGLDELDQLIAQDFAGAADVDDQDDWSFDEPVGSDGEQKTGVGEDEAATKLDLARAYIDMGDEEGARGILAEVLEEGNSGQRTQAQSLIEEIS